MSAKDFRDENTDFLFDAIISLKNIEEGAAHQQPGYFPDQRAPGSDLPHEDVRPAGI